MCGLGVPVGCRLRIGKRQAWTPMKHAKGMFKRWLLRAGKWPWKAKKEKFHTCGGPRRRPCLGQGRGRRILFVNRQWFAKFMDAEEDSRCGDSTHNLFLYLFLFFKEFDSGLASIRNLGPNLHHPQVIYNIYGCYKLTILIHWSGRVAHLGESSQDGQLCSEGPKALPAHGWQRWWGVECGRVPWSKTWAIAINSSHGDGWKCWNPIKMVVTWGWFMALALPH